MGITESHFGRLTEFNEALNLTAGKLFVTICVHKLTCYLVSVKTCIIN